MASVLRLKGIEAWPAVDIEPEMIRLGENRRYEEARQIHLPLGKEVWWRFHFDRIAGSDCHHRHFGGHAPASTLEGEGEGKTHCLHEQHAPSGFGSANVWA